MALVQVSGIGRRKKTKAERKQRRQEIKKNIKEKIKKRGKLLLKFNPATVPARNAFLLLVKLNVFNLATRLNLLIQKDPNKLKKFWEGIGGTWTNLVRNIGIGAKKRERKLSKQSKIGEVATAASAAVVSATPIIIKIVKLLKDAGINADTLIEAGKTVVRAVASKKIDDQAAAQETAETLEETGEAEPMDGETDFESETETESKTDGEDF